VARTLSLSVSPPLLPSLPRPSRSTSFRIIFILSSAILVNAIRPVVRESFFYFAFEYSIALPRRGNLATGEEGVVAGGRGRHPGAGDGVALCYRAIKVLLASSSPPAWRELICEPEGDSPSYDNFFLLAASAFVSPRKKKEKKKKKKCRKRSSYSSCFRSSRRVFGLSLRSILVRVRGALTRNLVIDKLQESLAELEKQTSRNHKSLVCLVHSA